MIGQRSLRWYSFFRPGAVGQKLGTDGFAATLRHHEPVVSQAPSRTSPNHRPAASGARSTACPGEQQHNTGYRNVYRDADEERHARQAQEEHGEMAVRDDRVF